MVLKAVVKEAKAATVVAKASHDLSRAGYDPSDYAGFNGTEKPVDQAGRDGQVRDRKARTGSVLRP